MTVASVQHVDGAWMARGGVRYLSVCSGVEAASLAWEPLGWTPVAFSEIAPFPSAVLAHRFGSNLPGEPLATNGVPNFGDMTNFQEWPDHAIDLLVGGTPCQSFSVAGLRAGLADPRGNLALIFIGIADRYRPEWVLWENVPGVLSSNGGRDFGAFLGAMGQLGYGWAYRVLDAQFVRVDGFGRAVPQRRRRVFVVGHHSGDARRAAAVLFDAASLRGDSAPRRKAGEGIASSTRSGVESGSDGGLGPSVARTLMRGQGKLDPELETFVAHALRGEGFDASEDGTGRGTPIVPVSTFAIQERAVSENPNVGPQGAGFQEGIAYDLRGREGGAQFEGPHDTANIRAASGGSSRSYVATRWVVRRLTPLECERLQGMPDGWTDVPYRGKPAADAPRYQAIGNSMAVNAMRWIGRRIAMAQAASRPLSEAS